MYMLCSCAIAPCGHCDYYYHIINTGNDIKPDMHECEI